MKTITFILIAFFLFSNLLIAQEDEKSNETRKYEIRAGFLIQTYDNSDFYNIDRYHVEYINNNGQDVIWYVGVAPEYNFGYSLEVLMQNKKHKKINLIIGGLYISGWTENSNIEMTDSIFIDYIYSSFYGSGLYTGINTKVGTDKIGIEANICLGYFSFGRYIYGRGDIPDFFEHEAFSSLGGLFNFGTYINFGSLNFNISFQTLNSGYKDKNIVISKGVKAGLGIKF
ncbi:MAG: hypothetical protein ABII90_12195 [Bacteroidota bacterium]